MVTITYAGKDMAGHLGDITNNLPKFGINEEWFTTMYTKATKLEISFDDVRELGKIFPAVGKILHGWKSHNNDTIDKGLKLLRSVLGETAWIGDLEAKVKKSKCDKRHNTYRILSLIGSKSILALREYHNGDPNCKYASHSPLIRPIQPEFNIDELSTPEIAELFLTGLIPFPGEGWTSNMLHDEKYGLAVVAKQPTATDEAIAVYGRVNPGVGVFIWTNDAADKKLSLATTDEGLFSCVCMYRDDLTVIVHATKGDNTSHPIGLDIRIQKPAVEEVAPTVVEIQDPIVNDYPNGKRYDPLAFVMHCVVSNFRSHSDFKFFTVDRNGILATVIIKNGLLNKKAAVGCMLRDVNGNEIPCRLHVSVKGTNGGFNDQRTNVPYTSPITMLCMNPFADELEQVVVHFYPTDASLKPITVTIDKSSPSVAYRFWGDETPVDLMSRLVNCELFHPSFHRTSVTFDDSKATLIVSRIIGCKIHVGLKTSNNGHIVPGRVHFDLTGHQKNSLDTRRNKKHSAFTFDTLNTKHMPVMGITAWFTPTGSNNSVKLHIPL